MSPFTNAPKGCVPVKEVRREGKGSEGKGNGREGGKGKGKGREGGEG